MWPPYHFLGLIISGALLVPMLLELLTGAPGWLAHLSHSEANSDFHVPCHGVGGRNGSVRESWCFVDTSVMFGAVRSPASTSVVWRVGEQESWTLQWLEEESSCLTAASHSFSCGWCSWEAGISCTASLATNRFFVAVKSAAIIRGTTSPVLSILPLLCVPVNPPLGA